MDKPPSPDRIAEQEAKYFETYEAKQGDLVALQQGIDTLVESGLIEEEVLKEIRFVTFDSDNLYVFTRGEHVSNDRFNVEEIPSSSQTGIRLFRIRHSGFIGRNREDYRGARAWLLCDEIETTSVNARRFPNENVLYQPELPQPAEILDVVSLPPFEPYDRIHQGRFNYLTDAIFHEAGHIEHRRLADWQQGEEPIADLPSEEQRARFLAVMRRTRILPQWVVDLIAENVGRRTLGEMYAMLIDREGARRYDIQIFHSRNREFERRLVDIESQSADQEFVGRFRQSLESAHMAGHLLVRILEEQFVDYAERSRFVRSALERASRKERGPDRA